MKKSEYLKQQADQAAQAASSPGLDREARVTYRAYALACHYAWWAAMDLEEFESKLTQLPAEAVTELLAHIPRGDL